MNETNQNKSLVLPASIITRVDVSRLTSELERLDSDLVTRDVHIKMGTPITDQITLSEQLTDFLAINNLEIGDGVERAELIKQVHHLKKTAPIVHMTFASSVDGESLRQLADWLRRSVHPQSIIAVGLQPSLIGGVFIRTSNRVHDLSMRAQLAGHRDLIVKEVEALRGSK